MVKPLAVLPLHLACQLLLPQNCSNLNVSFAADTKFPKAATELPDGYAIFQEVGAAYKKYKNSMQWDQARKVCTADGGHLAVVDSFRKIQFVKEIKETSAISWTGIHRLFEVEEWTDIKTGLPMISIPWRHQNWESDKSRRCAALYADASGLYAAPCGEVHPFVCEIPIFED